MPTIVIDQGFRIAVNIDDHLPPHVHIWKAGHEARFAVWNNHVQLYANKNMTERELKTAAALCGKHYDRIVSALEEMPWVK